MICPFIQIFALKGFQCCSLQTRWICTMPCPLIKSPRCYAWRPLKTNPGTFGKILNVKRLSQSWPTTFSFLFRTRHLWSHCTGSHCVNVKRGALWINLAKQKRSVPHITICSIPYFQIYSVHTVKRNQPGLFTYWQPPVSVSTVSSGPSPQSRLIITATSSNAKALLLFIYLFSTLSTH